MLKIALAFSCMFFFLNVVAAQDFQQLPLGGNAFVSPSSETKITENGIENWAVPNEMIKVYVRVAKVGTLSLLLSDIRKMEGAGVIEFSMLNEAKRIAFNEKSKMNMHIGTWQITDTGYVTITIKGISKTKTNFPALTSLLLGGTAIDAKSTYVKNNEGNFFYWGRRGPSVHLSYQMPTNVDAEWFYNEITVPAGNDIIGSYFMANGFAEGYFGIQVNAATERRILFSVWSPFNTDDPKKIPKDHQITMLKKGNGVHTGEFGNEGAGGQSYLKYNWKAGTTYKFLLRAQPSADQYTTFTAYFFAPELGKWQLIASFKRPKTQTYLKKPHSFLENFIPEYGDQTRQVWFNNQWICDAKGNWIAINTAKFTTDNTGNSNYRKDYAGGTINGQFFLKNCGFFNDFTPPKSQFTKPMPTQPPQINFAELP